MKKQAYRYLFAVSVLPLVLLAVLSVFWINRQALDQAGETLGNYLDATTALADLPDDPESFVRELSQQFSGDIRITLVDLSGNVLADSQSDASLMPSHAGREEIREAIASGQSSSVRYSSTEGRQMVYGARLWRDQYVLRLSMPVSDAREYALGLIPALLAGFLVLAVLISILVDRFARRLVQPYEQMLLYVENTLQEGSPKRPELPAYPELQPILKYFDYLLEQIASHISQISAKTDEIENIMGTMEEGLVMLDREWNILLLNRQAGKFLSIPSESWQKKLTYLYRNQTLADALEQADRERTRQIADILQEDRTYRFYINPVPDGGFVLLISDVSELVQLERMRSDFAANVSHELKTPLTSISGFAELLQTGMVTQPEQVRDYAGKIHTEAGRLVSLIDDILDLSSIENSQREEAEPVDMGGVFGYVLEMLAGQMEEKSITAAIEGSLWLCASRAHLYELAFNLCENGVKYNRDGGSLSIRLLENGFSVKDTGIGIPKEYQDRIFERFYRVDKARSRKTGGTGLGLSIAKHVMALYGGTIQVESGDEGSTFTSIFPQDLVYRPPGETPPLPRQAPVPKPR